MNERWAGHSLQSHERGAIIVRLTRRFLFITKHTELYTIQFTLLAHLSEFLPTRLIAQFSAIEILYQAHRSATLAHECSR